jgi:hypothetical protein
MNTYSNPQTNSRALVEQTMILCGIVTLAGIVLIAVSITLGATLLGMEFARWSAAILTFGASLLIAALIVRTWSSNRYLLVEPIAAYITRQDADSAKVKAEAEKILAEADRIDAESAALARATSAAQLNMNTGSGTMKVQNKPIQYNVAGTAIGQLTLNQTNQIDQRKIEIPAADVRWIAEQLGTGYGHSKNKWVKAHVELPYSRQTVTWEIYKAIMDALVSAEPPAIIGRDERASGKLIEQDPAQLVKLIEQTHPGAGSKGLVITPPTPSA